MIAQRAADCPRRPVEAGEEAVPGDVHLAAAEERELPPDELVVAFEHLVPGAVSERGGARARADDVGEEDRGQHPFRLGSFSRPPPPDLSQEHARDGRATA